MKKFFEIEKKFKVIPAQEKKLIKDSKFLGKKTNHDIYFDDSKYSLTTKDIWLRKRNDKYELKLPEHKGLDREVDNYREIDNEEEIKKTLKLPKNLSLETGLKQKGFNPVMDFITIRKSYINGPLHLDFDYTNFGYDLLEIEVMIDNLSEIKSAANIILEFAQKYGLENSTSVGKTTAYLRINNPTHLQVLIEAGVEK